MFFFTKNLSVPETNTTRTVQVAQTWEVRWESLGPRFIYRPEIEIFLTEPDAKAFAESLRRAFMLLRYTTGTQISVEKRA